MKYLVMLDTTLDNLPLRIFNNEREATEFAKTVEPSSREVTRACDVFSVDLAEPSCVSVIAFDSDDEVDKRTIIKDTFKETQQ